MICKEHRYRDHKNGHARDVIKLAQPGFRHSVEVWALPARPECAFGLPNWVRGTRMAFGRLRGPRVQVFPKSSSNLLHEASGRSPGHVSVVTPQRPPRCVQPAAASSGAVNSDGAVLLRPNLVSDI